MREIGGYLGLELGKDYQTFHSSFYSMNSGKNSLLLLLIEKKYKQLTIPYYICSSVKNSLLKNGIKLDYYNIDTNLQIIDESIFKKGGIILYVNYFGIKDNYIKKLSNKYENLIIDNAQAFFSKPVNNIDTIYSPRKFFGVPDGGFLFTSCNIDLEKYSFDYSYDRFAHLLKRLELPAMEGYKDFKINNEKIKSLKVLRMSKLTKLLLSKIDFKFICKIRRSNFQVLHKRLKDINKLNFELINEEVPLVYPLLLNKVGEEIKAKLIENNIYIATYWPNHEIKLDNNVENNLEKNLIPLPIDQRYNIEDMERILRLLSSWKYI